MGQSLFSLPTESTTAVALAAGIVFFAGICLLLHRRAKLLRRALDHMPQGMCWWTRNGRLIVCNQRYIEMYGMSPDIVKPGCTFRQIIQHRTEIGIFSGNIDAYVQEVLVRAQERKSTVHFINLADGRIIAVSEQPTAEGWVATHQDVTEQKREEDKQAERRALDQRRAKTDEAIRSFHDRVEIVLKSVGGNTAALKDTAGKLFGASEQTSQRAQNALNASNEASANVATASSAAAELSKSIGEISQQLVQTTDVLKLAVGEARSTNSDIKGLAEAAQRIGVVVQLIRDIAEQTNLLALNATIEAARAGDAGRGFAVVASEVKSLAVQTAKATEEISAQVLAVQSSTENAVKAIDRIATRMQDIEGSATAVAAAVEEQNAATGEISHNVAGAAGGASDIVAVLDEVAVAATETRSSAQTVLETSRALDQAISKLRSEVTAFLNEVAA